MVCIPIYITIQCLYVILSCNVRCDDGLWCRKLSGFTSDEQQAERHAVWHLSSCCMTGLQAVSKMHAWRYCSCWGSLTAANIGSCLFAGIATIGGIVHAICNSRQGSELSVTVQAGTENDAQHTCLLACLCWQGSLKTSLLRMELSAVHLHNVDTSDAGLKRWATRQSSGSMERNYWSKQSWMRSCMTCWLATSLWLHTSSLRLCLTGMATRYNLSAQPRSTFLAVKITVDAKTRIIPSQCCIRQHQALCSWRLNSCDTVSLQSLFGWYNLNLTGQNMRPLHLMVLDYSGRILEKSKKRENTSTQTTRAASLLGVHCWQRSCCCCSTSFQSLALRSTLTAFRPG